jgi:hypothetical protein
MAHHKGKRTHHPGMNRHHFFRAKSRGGSTSKKNLLWMNIERHAYWHRVFGTMGAEEVLALLERVVRAKEAQAA